MNTLITILLALTIVFILFLVFRWIKAPYYRVDKNQMIRILEMVLTGQATENDWRITFGMTIRHDPELEFIRQECCIIEENYFIRDSKTGFLFTKSGLEALKKQLEKLK